MAAFLGGQSRTLIERRWGWLGWLWVVGGIGGAGSQFWRRKKTSYKQFKIIKKIGAIFLKKFWHKGRKNNFDAKLIYVRKKRRKSNFLKSAQESVNIYKCPLGLTFESGTGTQWDEGSFLIQLGHIDLFKEALAATCHACTPVEIQ